VITISVPSVVVVVVVVVVMLTSPGPGDTPDVSHERLVERPSVSVMDLPATVTEIVEANSLSAEVRALLHCTHTAQCILQVWVNLNFLAEPRSLDLNEGSRHGLHVACFVVEGDATRPNRILVLVCVKAGVDNTLEQVVEDDCEGLSRHHAVESSHEDGLLRVQSGRTAADVVGVRQDPGNDLDLLVLGFGPPTGDLVVVRVPSVEVLTAFSQEVLDILLVREDEVQVALGRGGVVSPRPLHSHLTELGETLNESLLGDVPGDSSQEYLGGV